MASDPIAEAVKPAQSSRRKEWLFALALLTVTLAAYYPAWFGKPIWDDDAHMTTPQLRSWSGLWRIWTEPGATLQYYPLVHSVFWLEHKIWGDSTLGYHLVNILLHVFCALLLLRILRLLEVPGAWLAAAIFALHPVKVESVAWISELKNTLSGAFYLGAALVYLRFDRSRERRPYFIALGLFLLGLFSKTVIATLPAALLVVFWWKRGKLSWKRDVKPLVPFFVLGIAMGLLTAYVEKKYVIGDEGAAFRFTPLGRCLVAGRAFWFYIVKLIWPAKLVFIYPRWNVDTGVWLQWLFPIAALALLAALWMLRKRTRTPLAAALFFGGTLFPALGFINVYPFIYSFVADHFQYLAGIGIITLASAGAALLPERLRGLHGAAGPFLAVSVLMLLAALTWRQCRLYADTRTLYTKTIELNPGCWMAWNNLGADFQQQGQIDKAIADYEEALEIKPDHAEAHNNLGYALEQQGHLDDAIAHYKKALEILPNFAEAHYNLANALLEKGQSGDAIVHFQKAIEIRPDYAEAHFNLGNTLQQLGLLAQAVAQYQKALEITPGMLDAHLNLGNTFEQMGQVDDAIAEFQKALEIKPDYAIAQYDLGYTLQHSGHADTAVVHYQKALEIQPGYVAALNSLAYVFAACPQDSLRNGGKAVELAQRANQATGYSNPIVLGTLAAAYAETGRFSDAMKTAQRALDLANSQSNAALADHLQSQITLYKADTPFRDTSLGQ